MIKYKEKENVFVRYFPSISQANVVIFLLHTSYKMVCFINVGKAVKLLITNYHKRIAEGKDQESMQSSKTPDPGHHMGIVTKTKENNTHLRAKRPALSQQMTTRLQ